MRAAEMKERPGFSLMKQGDVQTIYHMQMPRWLFSDPRYADMSLDAKVTYTFLSTVSSSPAGTAGSIITARSLSSSPGRSWPGSCASVSSG